jgi:hypothetical protein
MSDNVDNLIIEHLKGLRNELKDFRSESKKNFMEVCARLQSLEERTSLAERGIANIHGDHALIHLRLDGIRDRVTGIESRLEIA